MGSKWFKVKLALGLNPCLYIPRNSTLEDEPPSAAAAGASDAVPPAGRSSDGAAVDMPTTPVPSSSGLRLPKNHSAKSSSKKTCAICLTPMKPGHGHAIFTAECSHSFHFQCITTNVKHGNQICPVCRAKWKQVPFEGTSIDFSHGKGRNNRVTMPRDDSWMNVLGQLPPPRLDFNRQISSHLQVAEPNMFDDDEHIEHQPKVGETGASSRDILNRAMEVKTYPELSAVSKSASHTNFTVLIHLKAPRSSGLQNHSTDQNNLPLISQKPRAPLDLVTVLDVSGSMAGTKLALLKRAMGFVVQNLGPSDRLSIIVFSSSARRVFPLRRMNEGGKLEAMQAVNSLNSGGGTNIAEGLKKGAKVMTDRKWENSVSSMILLSDGQDTYSITSPNGVSNQTNYQLLLPASIDQNDSTGLHIPIHTFGFGADHDAISMHSISEASSGTFSFIEAESVIQDAFAQCIGGLLSVVVQDLRVGVECIHPMLSLRSIKAGSYNTSLTSDKRMGYVELGDLYADEERDFLVTVDIPVDEASNETSLLKVKCVYKDSITKELITLDPASDVKIRRPETTGQLSVSMEVDKQRNRLQVAEAMANAREAAERNDLGAAVLVLEQCCKRLSETVSAKAGDKLCIALDAELKEMQERMANRRVYETSGRAYVLSGLSSHSWQRATARGDSTDSTSLFLAYQTPSMVDMVNRSQTMLFDSPSPRGRQRALRPVRSFPARPQPR